MAYDQRFWTAYVSSSGEGGAKLHRRDWGEIVENIANTAAYHWMAGNFLKYSGPLHANDLPVDSHELIAMCAPRPVFISAGKGGYDAEPGGDSWVDAKGSFLAGAAAGPVYKLLGKKPVDATEFPPIETLVGGNADVAFRQHGGGTPTDPIGPSSWILRRITYLPTYSPQVRALPDGHQILVIGTPISQANGPGKEMYVLNVDSGKYQRVVQRGALSSWRRRR